MGPALGLLVGLSPGLPALPAQPAMAAGVEAQGPNPSAANDGMAAAPSVGFAAFDDKLFLAARKSGAPVGLYFEADWCHPCKEMHARTLRAPAVLEAAAGIRFFRVDMTTPSHYLGILQKSFRVVGAPTFILFGPDGKERAHRFGFIPPDEFARMLREGSKPATSS